MLQQDAPKNLEESKNTTSINTNLHLKILVAICLGIPAGLLLHNNHLFIEICSFTGNLFLNALKMLIVPIILSSIVAGILRLPDIRELGKMGVSTIIYYFSTSILAVIVGCIFVFILKPGLSHSIPAGQLLGFSKQMVSSTINLSSSSLSDMKEIFIRMVPPNIVAAAAKGQMLGIIFFGILFGISGQLIHTGRKNVLANVVQAIFETTMKMTEIVMYFAPIGIFALVSKVFAQTGLGALKPLAIFFLTVILALGFHFFITLPLILRLFGVSAPRHMKNMTPALLTAFSTSSSSATLPVTMECVEKRAGIPNRISAFVLPLGATVNMDGTALYECVAALFIAQAMGIKIGFFKAFVIAFTAVITSIGVAGIPAASLVAIAVILKIVGLPVEAMAPILAVDRILDMLRTSVNVFSDSCGAVIISKIGKNE